MQIWKCSDLKKICICKGIFSQLQKLKLSNGKDVKLTIEKPTEKVETELKLFFFVGIFGKIRVNFKIPAGFFLPLLWVYLSWWRLCLFRQNLEVQFLWLIFPEWSKWIINITWKSKQMIKWNAHWTKFNYINSYKKKVQKPLPFLILTLFTDLLAWNLLNSIWYSNKLPFMSD